VADFHVRVDLRPDLDRLRAGPARHARLPRELARESIDAYLFIRRLVRRYGRVPIHTDGAGWYADACRWAGVEHVVYGHPLKNLMERMVQYVKEGTEAFDDLFPVRKSRLRSRRAFEHVLNWLSAFMSMQDFVFENGGLEWTEAPA